MARDSEHLSLSGPAWIQRLSVIPSDARFAPPVWPLRQVRRVRVPVVGGTTPQVPCDLFQWR